MKSTPPKHILLVVSGITPAIITEIFYKLHVEEKIPIAEIRAITTQSGQEALEEELLAGEGAFWQMCREYGIDAGKVKFDREGVVIVKDDSDMNLSDVASDAEIQLFPERAINLVRELTGEENTVLHACLSGGRKTMSFYLGVAMMLFGREQDELLHVLVSRDLEICKPKFYYPTKSDRIGRVAEDGAVREVNFKEAEIILGRIPYLKLRDKLFFTGVKLSYKTMVNLLQKQIDLLPDENAGDYPGLYPRGRLMQKLLLECRKLPVDDIALLTGETGTGKELVARYIHNLSRGREKPFIAVNLGGERAELISSTLFGHVKGAFTGAIGAKRGMFQEAAGGTIFLDEIDKLPNETQSIFLRVLEERKFRPVGENQPLTVECKIIIATNQNLELLVERGKFLGDLYYRISAFTYPLPPLRERPEDIVPLAKYFLEKYSRSLRKNFAAIDEALETFLLQHPWPGNVRELENLVKKLVAYHEGPELKYEFLDMPLRAEPGEKLHRIDRKVKEMIEQTLKDTGGNLAEATRLLEMNYSTLYSQVQKFRIDFKKFK
ncbi:MAG: TIGR02584 family CRISPR-associated protein [Calditrichaceae bacterium]|nr:CRISPR-associated ring nuclease Csm6 [Calditrichia bacterium]NUQ43910.1 TIGR02584 family CRISPR-associated protein [Calditrichaceae bacterium]